VKALEPTSCWELPAAAFRDLLRSSPEFALAVLRDQARQPREIDPRVADGALDPATGLADRQTLEFTYQRTAAAARHGLPGHLPRHRIGGRMTMPSAQ